MIGLHHLRTDQPTIFGGPAAPVFSCQVCTGATLQPPQHNGIQLADCNCSGPLQQREIILSIALACAHTNIQNIHNMNGEKKTMKIKTTKTATPLAHKKNANIHTQNNKAQKGHIMNPKYTIYTGHKAIGNGKKAE